MELFDRYPGDLNFHRAASFSKTYQRLSSELVTPTCRQAAESFQAKLETIRSTGIMPIDLVHWSLYLGKIAGYSLATNSMAFDQEIKSNEAAISLAEELYSQHLPTADKAWLSGHQLLAQLVKPLIEEPSRDPLVSGYIADGLRAVLGSMISGAWMSIETLFEDLWETALNNYPIELAIPVLESPNSSESGSASKEKSIAVSAFRKYGLDFSSCLGTILIDQRKVEFRTIAGAKKAYKTAFSGQVSALETTTDLTSFEAVRNILAHKNGVIDEKFISLTKKDPKFANVQLNESINLTGDLAKDFANIAIECGVKLLREVDSYLNELNSAPTRTL